MPILLDGYEGQYDWITHTFRYGGVRLTMDTVEDCFNVQVDHYVRFNFNSFVQIVDAVGGIDLNLTEDEAKALKAQGKEACSLLYKPDLLWNPVRYACVLEQLRRQFKKFKTYYPVHK